tara:strand:- start:197 stop:502 length:306 start_codon:yes stop_codon:yes gene_type:complete
MMKWEYYEKRRNVSLVNFIKGRDIESYEHLTQELAKQNVEPPALGMFQSAYAIAFPPVPKVQPKPKVKKPAAKKPAASKATPKTKTVEKKPTTRRRTTRKK